jgi:hypothetical protein
MTRPIRTIVAALFMTAVALPGSTAFGQGRPDTAALLAAQREALQKLAYMDGVWRGPAWTILASGQRHDITQTERIGPFLGGSVKVVEGRGYEADGKVGFNAFGIISYSPDTRAYVLHSYAQGLMGDFPLTLTADGYVWEIPAGPSKIRYTATIGNGAWREVGDLIAPGKDPVRIFEMNLKRVGDTKWPADGVIPPA